MKKHFIGINYHSFCPFKSSSLLLRRTFTVRKVQGSYNLFVCGLGLAVYYLNGRRINDHVLNTAPSDYDKTLWYDKIDITHLIKEGKNVIAVELGNGFYNESLKSDWNIDKSPSRGRKCLFLNLYQDNQLILFADEKFKVAYSPYMTFNELRSGERVDFINYFDFTDPDYDDSGWENAQRLKTHSRGKLRELDCEPIRECEVIFPKSIQQVDDKYLIDFGRNFSGYVSLRFKEKEGSVVTIRYAEEIDENNKLNINNCDCYYHKADFQTDILTSSGNEDYFKPKFSYYGFRYVEISGLTNLKEENIKAYFVHQDIKQKKFLDSKTPLYNRLFEAGINSTYSNMFYMLTDCPTREKLPWNNDAMASMWQIMDNFEAKKFFKKWMQDIIDSVDKDGNVSGISPSFGWGYEYGPVCSAILFALPYAYYKKYKSIALMKMAKPYLFHYYTYFLEHRESFILADWTGSTNHEKTPQEFVMDVYELIIYMVYAKTYKLLKDPLADEYENLGNIKRKNIELKYTREGKSLLVGQTPLSVLLVLGIGDKDIIDTQLLEEIKKCDYHLDVGMFGSQFIYRALIENHHRNIFEKIIKNPNYPSFACWIESGATTLYETFDLSARTVSKNHHMYSNFIEYLR